MPRLDGFKFKQFAIEHAGCAMKVGTDSILLGSWVEPESANKVLDIGTGSGLLAIMMAQKSKSQCQITGIDIDDGAVNQARKNASLSPWSARIAIEQTPLQDFAAEQRFDLIISNPPYFEGKTGQLSSDDPQFIDAARRTARHTFSLDNHHLIQHTLRLLSESGTCCFVMPLHKGMALKQLALQQGLHCARQLLVSTKFDRDPTRILLMLTRQSVVEEVQHLTVRDRDGQYSNAYRNLCKDFYLNF